MMESVQQENPTVVAPEKKPEGRYEYVSGAQLKLRELNEKRKKESAERREATEPGKLRQSILEAIDRYRRRLAKVATSKEFDDAKFRQYVKRIKTLMCCVEDITNGHQLDRMLSFLGAVEPLVPGVRVGAAKPERPGDPNGSIDDQLLRAGVDLLQKKGA